MLRLNRCSVNTLAVSSLRFVCLLAAMVATSIGTASIGTASIGTTSIGQEPAKLLSLDERPAAPGEWGYHPSDGETVPSNPPAFSWRPDGKVASWELQIRQGNAVVYEQSAIRWNVHCPSSVLAPGVYAWRYRGRSEDGHFTQWSRERTFTVEQNAKRMPMPPREELLGRIPTSHPRLFVRPEQLPALRAAAQGPLRAEYEKLKAQCDQLLENPPPTEEPPKYPEGMVRGGEPWREMWWGNRVYTIRALNGAATLAFTRLLDGNEEYGRLARRILLDCAQWDPKGSTGYRYNDEAGMPYAYYFSRTYTFLHDVLSEEDRRRCREVMKIRGEEMYDHLCPRHLWRPYASHSNRAWHFLGEVAVAFQGEIEGADDWADFAMHVFFCMYPVWNDSDGGWHEGSSYWSSYISRFTWWADIMQAAFRIDAYHKPYFASIGWYPMYLMPPGKLGGGLGDLTARRTARSNVPLMSILAAQAHNPYWQWYVEELGGPEPTSGYIGFVRGMQPQVAPKPPADRPTSRLFRGTGQAYLNTTIENADDDVQVVFKSSPFGTQSHGYEANNCFLLWAYGQRLLIRTGRRDMYGSDHHRNWMWSTRSVNAIRPEGIDQKRRSPEAIGRITAFHASPQLDVVAGQAAEAFGKNDQGTPILDTNERTVFFVKPELVIVYDRVAASEPRRFEYWLHAVNRFEASNQHQIDLTVEDVGLRTDLLLPEGLELTQTDQYDPNPRPRVTLREWHLTATTPAPTKRVEFLAVYRPHKLTGEGRPDVDSLQTDVTRLDGGYQLVADLIDGGTVTVLLPSQSDAVLRAGDLASKDGRAAVRRTNRDGETVSTYVLEPLP